MQCMQPEAFALRRIDFLVAVTAVVCCQADDDERDEVVEQINLHGNYLESMDGLEAFSGCVHTGVVFISLSCESIRVDRRNRCMYAL